VAAAALTATRYSRPVLALRPSRAGLPPAYIVLAWARPVIPVGMQVPAAAAAGAATLARGAAVEAVAHASGGEDDDSDGDDGFHIRTWAF
jgi:hypothetical protein